MNEFDQLASAVLTIAFSAVLLVERMPHISQQRHVKTRQREPAGFDFVLRRRRLAPAIPWQKHDSEIFNQFGPTSFRDRRWCHAYS